MKDIGEKTERTWCLLMTKRKKNSSKEQEDRCGNRKKIRCPAASSSVSKSDEGLEAVIQNKVVWKTHRRM